MGYFECGVTAGLKIVHWYKESESGDLSRVTSNGIKILPKRQYSSKFNSIHLEFDG